ncbi:MAG: PaaI family thioesterase [Actinomycetota bacterium]
MTTPDAPDPGFRSRIETSFANQAFMTTIGAQFTRIEPGVVAIALDAHRGLTQQHGFLHGGVIGALLDNVCGFATLSLLRADQGVLTVEYKVSLLRPGRGDRFEATGTVIKPGRTLSFCESVVFADGDTANPIATATATIMTMVGRGVVG